MRALLATLVLAPLAAAQDAIRFVQVSDSHLPRAASERVLREALAFAERTKVDLVLHTGDVTEFGGRGAAWGGYRALAAKRRVPVWTALGNHDLTWDGLFDKVGGGRPYHAVEVGGTRFLALCSGNYQDPRPGFGEDQLQWLERFLGKQALDPRLVLFLHHPPEGSEWAGRYELRRLHALLQGRSVAVLLVGHGHGARAGRFGNWPWIMGGSTFGENAGFGVGRLDCGSLSYTYRYAGAKREPKRLGPFVFETASEPELSIAELGVGEKLRARIEASAENGGLELRCFVDEENAPRATARASGTVELELDGLVGGLHVLAVEARDARGKTSFALRSFRTAREGEALDLAWSRRLPSAFAGPLALAGGRLCAAGRDGRVFVLDSASGQTIAERAFDAVVAGGATALEDRGFVLGLGSGELVALDLGGETLWTRALDAPIAATPLVVGERVVAATLAGEVAAFGLGGEPLWRRKAADWAIEKGPVALPGGRICFGAWDRKLRCLAVEDGRELWTLVARGARGKAARYYSPADCPPALASGRVFVADRKFELTVCDLDGKECGGLSQVAAIVASPQGDAVYLRGSAGTLRRIDPKTLRVVWETELPVGRTPTPPALGAGFVLVQGERDGILYLVDADDGSLRGRYRTRQAVYPFAPVLVAGDLAFTASLDGEISSVRCLAQAYGKNR